MAPIFLLTDDLDLWVFPDLLTATSWLEPDETLGPLAVEIFDADGYQFIAHNRGRRVIAERTGRRDLVRLQEIVMRYPVFEGSTDLAMHPAEIARRALEMQSGRRRPRIFNFLRREDDRG